MTALPESSTLVHWSEAVALVGQLLELDPGFAQLAPAQQLEMLRAVDDAGTARKSEAMERQAEIWAAAAARRALPRDMRRIATVLPELTPADQLRVCGPLRALDLGGLRAVLIDLDQRDVGATMTTLLVAAVLTTLRTLPTVLLAVLALLLLDEIGPDQPCPTSARPPDQPSKQARPSRSPRVPHGPDSLAVGRTRHPAGVPALRAA